MKLITLNIWGGHVRHPLLNFIKKYQETDIFCFQEVYHNAPKTICDDEKFADYVFSCPKIKVNSFGVLPEEVSDHAALLLDFE